MIELLPLKTRSLKKMTRLSIGVLATNVSDKYREQIDACLETWYTDAKPGKVAVHFFGGYIRYDHPAYVNLADVAEDYQSATDKQYFGLRWLKKNAPADFYMIIGTDNYLNIHNILKELKHCTPDEDLYLGGHGWYKTTPTGDTFYFHSGGAGIVLSRRTLDRIEPHFESIIEGWKLVCPDLPAACDVSLAHTLFKLKIDPTFNSNMFACNYLGDINGYYCHANIDRDTAITLHYMSPEQLRETHRFINRKHDPRWTIVTEISSPKQRSEVLKLDVEMVIFVTAKTYIEVWKARRELLDKTFFITADSDKKFALVHKAAKANHFNSTHFAWIDHTESVDGINEILEHGRDRFSISIIGCQGKPIFNLNFFTGTVREIIAISEAVLKAGSETSALSGLYNITRFECYFGPNYLGIEEFDVQLVAILVQLRNYGFCALAVDLARRLLQTDLDPERIVLISREYFAAAWKLDFKMECVNIIRDLIDFADEDPSVLKFITPADLKNFDQILQLTSRERVIVKDLDTLQEERSKNPDAILIVQTTSVDSRILPNFNVITRQNGPLLERTLQ